MTTGNHRGAAGAPSLVFLTVLIGLAGLLRFPGLFTELWLDEIWALGNVLPLDSAVQVLTAVHHDSNHYLVSLWMYVLGNGRSFAWYRLPSFLAGIAAVPAAGVLARTDREGRPALAMLLVAFSFPLGFYSSEARGYSLAVLAAFVAMYCLVCFAANGEARFLAGYALSTALGILAHLSFLIVLLAAIAFGLVLVGRGRMRFLELVALHGVAAAVLVLLFTLDLRYLHLGGGPHESPSLLLARTASFAMGGPVEGIAASLVAVLCAVLLIAELVRRIRRFWPERAGTEPDAYLWVFYAAVIGLPVWLALVLDPPFLFPRYFLVSIAFMPLLLASLAGSLDRLWTLVLLAVLLGANVWAWSGFARVGRGHYSEALDRILESAPGGEVTVGSDQDFRNERIVRFYRARLGEKGARLIYLPQESGAADFWIGSLSGSTCEGCRLLGVYPSSEISGATWRLYRRDRSSDERQNEGTPVPHAKASRGAEAVLTLMPPNLKSTDYRRFQDWVGEATAKAIQAKGTDRVVFLSGVGAEVPKGTGPITGLHAQEERLRKLEDVQVLVLQAGYFFENFYRTLGLIRQQGINGGATAPDVLIARIATRDIGDFAAKVLHERDFEGFVVHELLGERDLTLAQATRILATAIGKPDLKYVQFPAPDFVKSLVSIGVSENVAKLYSEMADTLSKGKVKSVEGRRAENTTPTSFEKFVPELAKAYQAM